MADEEEAASPLLDSFVTWFEAEGIAAMFDEFIGKHCSKFADASGDSEGGEQNLEWHGLYLEYCGMFDARLSDFLSQAGATQEEFLLAAKEAGGLHEAYLQIFLAHAEYETFIGLMVEEAQKAS